jgi:1-acyl-sn-glycerol-3-phosphate acyltransferase
MTDPIPIPQPSPAPPPRRPYKYRGEGNGLWQRFQWNMGRFFSRVLSMLLFRLHVGGQAGIPKTGGILMVTNHQSFLDPWLIGIAPSRQIHYMARDNLFKGGFLQYAAETCNAFPVKRGHADLTAIRMAVERLDKGYIVNIFPEGTRSEDGTIGPVAPGVSLILSRCKAEVWLLPVIIDGAHEAWPRHAKMPRAHPIRIQYGRAIPPAEWKPLGPGDLAWRIRRALVALQRSIGSSHAGASEARLEKDLAQAAVAPQRTRKRQRA